MSTSAETGERPVILTVDDDPGVSRAVARDLRRRYAETHRIVRAESGEEALEALRGLKLRGARVAAILADHRMPGMTGVEMLEQAMDVFPHARRALLTAYADTDAAIRAINVVDLDHYLLKPWDPPDEKLYPVVDALLDAWRAAGDHEVEGIRVVGHRLSAASHDVRDFLARNQVPYRWFGADEAEGARLLEAAGAGPDDVPVVVTAEGTALRRPSTGELATAVGLATEPTTDFYDLVIVGAGPAGLGAAVYGASEGLRTVLVERYSSGGQAGQSARIENYLGFPDGVSGAQLTDRARRQAVRFGAELLTTRDVVGLEARGGARVLRFADGGEVAAHAVVLATGVSYRRMGVPGEEDLTGHGLFYGSAAVEAPGCADEEVVVVGGANSAGQAAVHLARYARRVRVLVRGDDLGRAMSHYLVEQIARTPGVEVRTCAEVAALEGAPRLERVAVRDSRTGATETVDAPWCFVFIGAEPGTGWLDGTLERDRRGFLRTGPDLLVDGRRPDGWPLDRDPYILEASIPGVFVAGDVRAESVKRVASAVGEGAMAVTLVHRYLEGR
ncbi:MAG TPA: FAD-dependent oxidoreductase [Jiangellales bacterium]|nr:FAD-dependent oxidoreductase [Jiangellales bacterium]